MAIEVKKVEDQTQFDKVDMGNGEAVYEATCPFDSTIKPRAIKKVIEKPIIVEKKEKDLIASEPVKPTKPTVKK